MPPGSRIGSCTAGAIQEAEALAYYETLNEWHMPYGRRWSQS
jgi:hypothetical protein